MPEQAFRSDASHMAWLSSAHLWALCVMSIRLVSERVLSLRLGLWLCGAMAWMAFDEQFMLHELWKYGCTDWLTMCRFGWVTELPMLLVGLLGVATGVWLHVALAGTGARPQLWAAIATGVCALAVDLGGAPAALVLYEEGLEVLAEALFLGLLLGMRRASPPI